MKLTTVGRALMIGGVLWGGLRSGPAWATTSHIKIYNFTTHRVCFAATTSYYIANQGGGTLTKGWTCVAANGGTFEFDDVDYTYVSAVDETNADFLQNRLTQYNSVTTYAPKASVAAFGVDTRSIGNDQFEYSYFLNSDAWADYATAQNRDELVAAVEEHGFRQITGRIFRAADYPGGLGVAINF